MFGFALDVTGFVFSMAGFAFGGGRRCRVAASGGEPEAAAAKVQADPAFAPYMTAITGVTLMQHFETKGMI